MKTLTMAAALVLAPSLAFAQVAPDQVRVVERTDSASGNVSTHDGCNDFYMSVSRNQNQDGSVHGYLSYSEWNNCNSTQGANGSGEIPVSSVTGDGKTSLKFRIDAGTVRNFIFTGEPLKANLTWKAIPGDFYNGRSSGNSQTGTVRSRYTGKYGQSTAAVTGTINLGDLDDANAASISWSKNKYVTIDTRAARSLAPAIQ